MKYQFITEYQHEYPITVMCRVLEVDVAWILWLAQTCSSEQSREDAQLAEKVKVAFQANRRVYGSPRVHAELRAQGIHCARKRVARLMLGTCDSLRNVHTIARSPRKASQVHKWLPTRR
jgi:putative transposase